MTTTRISRASTRVHRAVRIPCTKVVIAIFILAGLAAVPVRADSITVTPNMTSVNVTEGQSFMVTWSVTVDVTPGALDLTNLGPEFFFRSGTGDSSDFGSVTFAPFSFSSTCAGLTFSAAGDGTSANTCSFSMGFDTGEPGDSSETDGNSGSITLLVPYAACPPTIGVCTVGNSNITVTVFDVGAGPSTPEPPSLLLMGTGLFGLLGAARRRLFR